MRKRAAFHRFQAQGFIGMDQVALAHFDSAHVCNIARAENGQLEADQYEQRNTALVHQAVTILMRGPTSTNRSYGPSFFKKVCVPKPFWL